MSSTHSPEIQSLFEDALREYEKRAGTNLIENELSSKLKSCDSAKSVIEVLQNQAQEFRKYRGDSGRMVSRFKQAVEVLYALSTSTVLVECIGMIPFSPAKAIFAGIGILVTAIKDVSASYDALGDLFELMENFLRRLNIYTKVQLTTRTEMTEIVVKILIELLAMLALATQQVRQGRLIKFGKKLLGEGKVEDLLKKLDELTREESRMTAALTLEFIYALTRSMREVTENEKATTDDVQRVLASLEEILNYERRKDRDRSRKNSRRWLLPPDPSQNQNIAYEVYHDGTATWFIQGDTFLEWKSRGSLLWIHGKPGSGKSVLCSAVIKYIESMQESAASMAFFYFDFRDDEKRNRRGLLASLLVQFCAQSDHCCDILSRLYSEHSDGLRQPNDGVLFGCLKEMLGVKELGENYIVVDAIDECPIISGTRKKVLELVTNLVKLNIPNLHLCVTSRPEADVLNALRPVVSHSVSLDNEMGQREGISNYISFFVNSDELMSQWRKEERDLVINRLRQGAAGMFRWVSCQLDKLRHCLPARIRTALDELPETLDETYERTLRGINEVNWRCAYRLFQCIAVASRPLRVEELSEFLAIDFDGGTPTLVDDWRPADPGYAILSTCSSLVTVSTVDGSSFVRFSHFSVQEFLMANRFVSERAKRYYISLEPAHTMVAQACLSVLLLLDNHVNKRSIEKYPLARYAAQHWVEHAKFTDMSSRAEDAIKQLFDQHLAAWVWIYDVDPESPDSENPSQLSAPPIYYATLWDLPGIAEWLVTARSQDVNKKGGYYGTALCAAAARGHPNVAQVLVKYGAHVDAAGGKGWSPLLWASDSGCLELSQLMLDLRANINFRDSSGRTPLSLASEKSHLEVVWLLLERGADANVWEHGKGTILIKALQRKDLEFAELLLKYRADVNACNDDGTSLLHLASGHGNLESMDWLFKHGANFPARNNPWWRRIFDSLLSFYLHYIINPNGRIRLPDDEEDKSQGSTTKRRALLVGISYAWSQSDAWWPLENPHADVDLFWSLLVGVYGYSPEDIVVLKDGPNFPNLFQPTRANMIHELKRLVFGAASGDKFTFFYSGHSDQVKSRDGLDVEEDGQDEVIVTSDMEYIVDNELNDILVKPLPEGCFLLSVFDTCHSVTMLDLPHHHCNGVYVPWHSKGERAMPTMRNKIVPNHRLGSRSYDPAFQTPSIAGVMAQNIDNNIRLYTDPLPSPCARLRIDTQVGGSTDEANRRWMSIVGLEGYTFVTCDGWCDYDPFVRKTVLSLSACSDPQRAWEGPRGSLTTVLCKYLKTQPCPSYRDLMSHVNFALHENARELHAYTREQKKREARGEGNGFDGELDNFQEPKLSSLAKLNMDDVFHL